MSDRITIFIAGDFYAGHRTSELVSHEQYDNIFNDLLPLIRECDIAVVNLESALTDSTHQFSKIGPAIKASPKVIEALKYAGFNLVTLANNHIMDYGLAGLNSTIELCSDAAINYCGAGHNLAEARSVFYQMVEKKTLAFINIAENEFSTTNDDLPGTNPLNPVVNYSSIEEARRKADFVFVIVHGGHEMYQWPTIRMKQTFRFFIDIGADAVLCHHAHCFSGYETYKGRYIFYGLGNFIFDKPKLRNSIWNYGYAVRLIIENQNLSFNIVPYEQNNLEPGVRTLKSDRLKSFHDELETICKDIEDDQLLTEKFSTFCLEVATSYNAYLEPYSNRFLHILRKRGILPTLIGKRKRMLLLNLIRCESHRDVLLNILKK